MPKPFASARISEELNTAIEKRSEKTGESRSDIIINALKAYLEADAEVPLSPEKRFEALENRVTHLEEQLNQPAQMALFDNKTDDTSDNKKETTNSVIKTDNKREKWTNEQLGEFGIIRQTLNSRIKAQKMPYSKNSVTVHRKVGIEKRNGRNVTLWEVSQDS